MSDEMIENKRCGCGHSVVAHTGGECGLNFCGCKEFRERVLHILPDTTKKAKRGEGQGPMMSTKLKTQDDYDDDVLDATAALVCKVGGGFVRLGLRYDLAMEVIDLIKDGLENPDAVQRRA